MRSNQQIVGRIVVRQGQTGRPVFVRDELLAGRGLRWQLMGFDLRLNTDTISSYDILSIGRPPKKIEILGCGLMSPPWPLHAECLDGRKGGFECLHDRARSLKISALSRRRQIERHDAVGIQLEPGAPKRIRPWSDGMG